MVMTADNVAAYVPADQVQNIHAGGAPLDRPSVALAISKRTRSTPFTGRVEEAGVKGYSVYNRMLIPAVFESLEADYWHLKAHVQVWDVSCERQIEVSGPDALQLLKLTVPRDLTNIAVGQCVYTPLVDPQGRVLNDPVTIKHADDRYWVSLADSDAGLWLQGLAVGRGLDVRVEEADIAPLAVQGPKADDLMARVFGAEIRDVRFFRGAWFDFQGTRMFIARSGYSKQGGFEIYVPGTEIAEPLWDALMASGDDLDVRAGGPNLIERVEGGLLSYGNDMTAEHTLLECGLDRFCKFADAPECLAHGALMAMQADGGAPRVLRRLKIDGPPMPACTSAWPLEANGEHAGTATSATWSPEQQAGVAIAMVERDYWEPGTELEIFLPNGTTRRAEVLSI